jgi:hypothetical protein
VRDPSLVLFQAVVGVPWQDIAYDPGDPTSFMTADDLAQPDGNGLTRWDLIVGDPAAFVPPLDPLMVESIDPRTGKNPVTGDDLAPRGSPAGANPITGHEYSIPNRDELEYACVFDLSVPRDCSQPQFACDCSDPANDKLCEAGTGGATLQVRAKAYPGRRELALLEELAWQGVVPSICPAQVSDAGAADFGYRPAVRAMVGRMARCLGGSP